MTTIKHFIYDFDGTIDDAMPGHTLAFLKVLASRGVAEKELESKGAEYNNSAGTPLREQFAQALSSLGMHANLDDCVSQFWELHVDDKANPFPGAKALIEEVHARGGKQYITTGSKTERARSCIGKMGLLPYFTLILGQGDGIDKGRQHLQMFKEDSGDSGFEMRAVYLGDGPKDMEYARDFGIMAVGISTTLPERKLRDAGAHYVIDSLEQFLPLIARIKNPQS